MEHFSTKDEAVSKSKVLATGGNLKVWKKMAVGAFFAKQFKDSAARQPGFT